MGKTVCPRNLALGCRDVLNYLHLLTAVRDRMGWVHAGCFIYAEVPGHRGLTWLSVRHYEFLFLLNKIKVTLSTPEMRTALGCFKCPQRYRAINVRL